MNQDSSNQDPSFEQQQRKLEREAILINELFKLSLQAWKTGRITQSGWDSTGLEMRWFFQREGKTEYCSLEEAKSVLEGIIKEAA